MAILVAVVAARAAAAAPGVPDDDEVALRRQLRADKLALALAGHPLLPDGARVTAARLAAAPVWFEDEAPTSRCADGQPRHRLWRYAFDEAHRDRKSVV